LPTSDGWTSTRATICCAKRGRHERLHRPTRLQFLGGGSLLSSLVSEIGRHDACKLKINGGVQKSPRELEFGPRMRMHAWKRMLGQRSGGRASPVPVNARGLHWPLRPTHQGFTVRDRARLSSGVVWTPSSPLQLQLSTLWPHNSEHCCLNRRVQHGVVD